MRKTKKLTIEVQELTVEQVKRVRDSMLDPERPFYMVDELDRCLCLLIRHGHARPWEYGWCFFLAALEELAEAVRRTARP